jgi:glycogen phosphorylase
LSPIKALTAWKMKVYGQWPQIRIQNVSPATDKPVKVGEKLQVDARIQLGNFTSEDVQVELYYGKLDFKDSVVSPSTAVMDPAGKEGNLTVFKGVLPCDVAGDHGYAVRVIPKNKHMIQKYIPGLIHWQE